MPDERPAQTESKPGWEIAGPSTSCYEHANNNVPQAIFRLIRLKNASGDQELEIVLPGKLIGSGGFSGSIWLRLEPLECNDAAKVAWRVSEPIQLSMLLRQLAKADDKFIEALALVAMSVAAPKGFVPQQGPMACTKFFPQPKSSRLVPGTAP